MLKLKILSFLKGRNKKIEFKGDDMINILKEINLILCSLDHIGGYYCDKDLSQFDKEATNFIDNSCVCERLSAIRRVLCEKLEIETGKDEMEDLEKACKNMPYWIKPGEYTTKGWLKRRYKV